MIDRSFKVCNNWNFFHNDIENIKSNLTENAYPPFITDKVIKNYLNHKFSSNQKQLKDTPDVHYFKLPYIGNLSHYIKNKLSKLCKEFCKENFNFNSFTCASCSSSYIDETCHHFKTRIEEHIKKDNKSHIFKYLHSTATCFGSCNSLCFKIIDKANSKLDLKIKEALRIEGSKRTTKSFSSHPFTIASVLPCSFLSLFFFVFLFFAFLFPLLFSLPLTLISIIYCLNYTSLLRHLVTTRLLSHPFLSSIIFIISTLIVGIFYCLNYTSSH